jgi:phosphoglycolate phosphatase
MKTYGAAIFDMDGTLLDTLVDLGNCMNRVLAGSGYPGHPIEAYKHFVGDGMRNLAERVLPEDNRDESTIERISAEMVSEYGKGWEEKTALYPGIAPLLDELARRGIRRAILSNKPHQLTDIMARRYFGRWGFDPVFGARDGVPRKPDPASALEICRAWGLEPGEVLYAGDTNTDMRTAREAGMFALGVLWGFRSREELIEYGAQALIAEPGQMLSFFRSP